jgi:hypothetical protein
MRLAARWCCIHSHVVVTIIGVRVLLRLSMTI